MIVMYVFYTNTVVFNLNVFNEITVTFSLSLFLSLSYKVYTNWFNMQINGPYQMHGLSFAIIIYYTQLVLSWFSHTIASFNVDSVATELYDNVIIMIQICAKFTASRQSKINAGSFARF